MTRALLFDVDGTLIDSNDAHGRAWVAALAEAGHAVPFDRVRPLIGMGGDKMLPALVPGAADDTEPGKTILKRRLEIFKERELHGVAPTRGARELLEAVRARGDLGPLVDVASTSDDAKESKPDPDIIDAALRNAGLDGRDAVMVGDTKYDIAAAHRAGVACIVLRCGGNDPASLREADALYSDPEELTGALDAPPFTWPESVDAPT